MPISDILMGRKGKTPAGEVGVFRKSIAAVVKKLRQTMIKLGKTDNVFQFDTM